MFNSVEMASQEANCTKFNIPLNHSLHPSSIYQTISERLIIIYEELLFYVGNTRGGLTFSADGWPQLFFI